MGAYFYLPVNGGGGQNTMNWISTWDLKEIFPTSWRSEQTRLKVKWDKTPTDDELKDLKEILKSYLEYAETQIDKDIINGILANEEFFKRAILVTDGSYIPLRIYAWTIYGKVHMNLGLSFAEAKHNSQYNEYIQQHKHSIEETLQWILDNYQTIPFQCMPYATLLDREKLRHSKCTM